MARRNTRTGDMQEQMVIPALLLGGYQTTRNVNIGQRPSGGRHLIDVLAVDPNDGRRILISLKWQQVAGTAEQKIPFEILCLAHALREPDNGYDTAYLVLGGPGWRLRDFYVNRGLDAHMTHSRLVNVRSLEDFVAQANRSHL